MLFCYKSIGLAKNSLFLLFAFYQSTPYRAKMIPSICKLIHVATLLEVSTLLIIACEVAPTSLSILTSLSPYSLCVSHSTFSVMPSLSLHLRLLHLLFLLSRCSFPRIVPVFQGSAQRTSLITQPKILTPYYASFLQIFNSIYKHQVSCLT